MTTDFCVAINPITEPNTARTAELERLGDEIAELAAHLDAATARLLELISASRVRFSDGIDCDAKIGSHRASPCADSKP